MSGEDRQAQNTDREIWREIPGEFYSDSIHVTQDGKIGINCGGTVIVMPVRKWHELAETYFRYDTEIAPGQYREKK